MSTKTANGTGAKNDATLNKDTANGAAVMKAITETKPETPNLIQVRLKRINDAQKLIEKRKQLMDGQDVIGRFEGNMNGEDDEINLSTLRGKELPITKPDAVKKVVELLKKDIQTNLAEVEKELLNISI
jgi:hypothetical protein